MVVAGNFAVVTEEYRATMAPYLVGLDDVKVASEPSKKNEDKREIVVLHDAIIGRGG